MTAIDPISHETDQTKVSYDGNRQGETVAVAIRPPEAARRETIRDHAACRWPGSSPSKRARPPAVGPATHDKKGRQAW
jgi:hypothetical protein